MKYTIIATILALLLIFGASALSKSGAKNNNESLKDNVTVVDGKQIIELTAKGGYQPRKSTAKAGMPTILRVNTNGTFDCSSAIRIPGMNISRNLPQSGSTDIDIGTQPAGIFRGTCGMGMYPFEVNFQ